MLCPKDFKPCMDDLCYGAGCLYTGEAMYDLCTGGCGQYVSDEDDDDCLCEDDRYYRDGFDPYGDED